VTALSLFGLKGPPEPTGPGREAAATTDMPAPAEEPLPTSAVKAASDAGAERPDPPPVSEAELPPQIQRFLEANVYPPTSRPLRSGATDLLRPNRRYEKPHPLDEDRDVTSVFTADRYYYTGDEVAHVWLEVLRGDRPAAIRVQRAIALAEGEGTSPALVDLGLRPDGARWSGALDLESTFPDHHGTILLEVSFEVDGGEVHGEAIRIFTTPLDRVPARVTGDFRDSVREGSLLVEVGVDVFEPGFFRFDANLYDRAGEPVAFSVFKGMLAPGEQWIPLEFFGKILRDESALGPYSVEQIRGYRFLEGQTPDRERLVDDPVTHRTLAYDLALFSDEEYTSEHKERMIALMREDVEAGRTLDVPPLAAKPR
jgi:hypothetical protein